MAFEDNYAYRQAIDLVKTGLASGAIKLHGASNNIARASDEGAADAQYLIALIRELSKELAQE